jgi:quercetin dioxygenase-like cupin family protein
MKPSVRAIAWIAFLAAASATGVYSQAPGIQRTIVHRADVSVPGREAVIARVEIAPGASAGLHTHPGDEITYVMEGEAEILVEGQPARRVKAGDGFVIPAGAKHDAHNTGSVPVRLAGIYVVEKGKPLATPATK